MAGRDEEAARKAVFVMFARVLLEDVHLIVRERVAITQLTTVETRSIRIDDNSIYMRNVTIDSHLPQSQIAMSSSYLRWQLVIFM